MHRDKVTEMQIRRQYQHMCHVFRVTYSVDDILMRLFFFPFQRVRLEAHVKFSILWHLTRDLNMNKFSPFIRTFDRLVDVVKLPNLFKTIVFP